MTKQSRHKGVEILCIGSELLLGDILNTNAHWIAKELAELGLPHYIQTVVGDNSFRLRNTCLEAAKRSRILITTGGLGPTPDDLTTETIADAFNTPLEERLEAWLDIQSKTSTKGQASARCNRKQALLPIGAKIIPNPSGTAPGMIWQPTKDFTILTFPGVPSELKKMWSQTAKSWLRENGESENTFVSRFLKITNIPEAKLAEDLQDLLKKNNPTLAPYANLGEVKLRLTAKARTISEAKKLLRPLEKEIRNRTGFDCYGSDDEDMSSVVIELLRKRGETLAIAESCTGGGLGASLSAVPGASDVLVGGVIAYSNAIKENLLGVPSSVLKQYGAVSREVAEAMAKGAKEKLASDWAISITGLAGPGGGTNTKQVGFVHIAIAGEKVCESNLNVFGQTRQRLEIQELSVLSGLNQLRLILLSQN